MREFGLSLALLSTASMCSAADNGGPLSLRISDDFTSPGDPARSIERVSDPAFRRFISTAMGELGSEASVQPTATSPDLRFVRIALAASGEEVPPLPVTCVAVHRLLQDSQPVARRRHR